MTDLNPVKETLTQVANSAINFHDSVLEEIVNNPDEWDYNTLANKAKEYMEDGEFQTAILLLALAESEGDW